MTEVFSPVEDDPHLPRNGTVVATNHQQALSSGSGIVAVPKKVVRRAIEQLCCRSKRSVRFYCRHHYRLAADIEKFFAIAGPDRHCATLGGNHNTMRPTRIILDINF